MLSYILLTFAAYRIARLILVDTVFEPVRKLVGRQVKRGKFWFWLAELLNCAHCTGIWVAALLVVWFTGYSISEIFLWWLAVAGGQSLLATLAEHGNQD